MNGHLPFPIQITHEQASRLSIQDLQFLAGLLHSAPTELAHAEVEMGGHCRTTGYRRKLKHLQSLSSAGAIVYEILPRKRGEVRRARVQIRNPAPPAPAVTYTAADAPAVAPAGRARAFAAAHPEVSEAEYQAIRATIPEASADRFDAALRFALMSAAKANVAPAALPAYLQKGARQALAFKVEVDEPSIAERFPIVERRGDTRKSPEAQAEFYKHVVDPEFSRTRALDQRLDRPEYWRRIYAEQDAYRARMRALAKPSTRTAAAATRTEA